MACGIPVIAPPIGGPTEIVRNNVEGFLIDVKDQKKLIEQIKIIQTNKGLRAKLSQEAKIRVGYFSEKKFK